MIRHAAGIFILLTVLFFMHEATFMGPFCDFVMKCRQMFLWDLQDHKVSKTRCSVGPFPRTVNVDSAGRPRRQRRNNKLSLSSAQPARGDEGVNTPGGRYWQIQRAHENPVPTHLPNDVAFSIGEHASLQR